LASRTAKFSNKGHSYEQKAMSQHVCNCHLN